MADKGWNGKAYACEAIVGCLWTIIRFLGRQYVSVWTSFYGIL